MAGTEAQLDSCQLAGRRLEFAGVCKEAAPMRRIWPYDRLETLLIAFGPPLLAGGCLGLHYGCDRPMSIGMIVAGGMFAVVFTIPALAKLLYFRNLTCTRPALSDARYYATFFHAAGDDPRVVTALRGMIAGRLRPVGGMRIWPSDRLEEDLEVGRRVPERWRRLQEEVAGRFGLPEDEAGSWETVGDIYDSVEECASEEARNELPDVVPTWAGRRRALLVVTLGLLILAVGAHLWFGLVPAATLNVNRALGSADVVEIVAAMNDPERGSRWFETWRYRFYYGDKHYEGSQHVGWIGQFIFRKEAERKSLPVLFAKSDPGRSAIRVPDLGLGLLLLEAVLVGLAIHDLLGVVRGRRSLLYS
jgi:hypothetical protein